MAWGRPVTICPALNQFATTSQEKAGFRTGVARTVSSRPRLRVEPPFRLKRMKPVAYGPRTSLTIASRVTLRYTVPSRPSRLLKKLTSAPISQDLANSGLRAGFGPQKPYPYPPKDVDLDSSAAR